MALRFSKLTRPAIRKLTPGQHISEQGITARCLATGDTHYTINIQVDGQRIHRVIGRASDGTTRSQCQSFIESARSDARVERLGLPKGRKTHLTFKALAGRYLERLRETDAKDYTNNEAHLNLHLTPFLGAMRADKIADFTIEKYKRHCRDKGLADATINRTLATFRRMGRRMAGELSAPFPAVKIPRETNRRTYILDEDDEGKLLEAALGDSNSYVWLFTKVALATSLRHSEILRARFEHFDPMKRRLGVRVKGGRWRQQPLTRSITEILQHEREMASDSDGWIFPNKATKTGHYDRMVKAFRRSVVRAKLDQAVLTPHALRHTAITRLVAIGTDVKTVMEFSGHESLEMVMRYTHKQDRAIDAALDRMDSGTIAKLPATRERANS